MLGFNENSFLKTTNQFSYDHNVVSSDLIEDFIKKTVKGELPRYYKSDEPHPLAPIRQLVGSDFDSTILKNDADHVVY